MESNGGIGNSDQDIKDFESLDIELKYLTHDARDVIDSEGLGGITMKWQILLMEYCYNHGVAIVIKFLKGIDATTPNMTAKDKIETLGWALSSKKTRRDLHIKVGTTKFEKVGGADFDLNGSYNLYVLDRSIVIADYSANLKRLSLLLNKLPRCLLLEWIDQMDRCRMPIALYDLQERYSVYLESRQQMERMAQITLPDYTPMDEEGRQILRGVLEKIRDIKKDNAKVEG